jgi:hypothetical protein
MLHECLKGNKKLNEGSKCLLSFTTDLIATQVKSYMNAKLISMNLFPFFQWISYTEMISTISLYFNYMHTYSTGYLGCALKQLQ